MPSSSEERVEDSLSGGVCAPWIDWVWCCGEIVVAECMLCILSCLVLDARRVAMNASMAACCGSVGAIFGTLAIVDVVLLRGAQRLASNFRGKD